MSEMGMNAIMISIEIILCRRFILKDSLRMLGQMGIKMKVVTLVFIKLAMKLTGGVT